MPLDNIVRKIREQAEEAASGILAQAKETAERRLKDAEEAANAAAQEVIFRAETDAKRTLVIAEGRSDTGYRQALLREKQGLVEKVFEEALDRLAKVPSKEYRNFLEKAILAHAVGDEELIVGQDDRTRIDDQFVASLNSKLKDLGKAGAIKLNYGPDSYGGGFVLKRGGIAKNVTFPAILRKMIDELEIEVARILFG